MTSRSGLIVSDMQCKLQIIEVHFCVLFYFTFTWNHYEVHKSFAALRLKLNLSYMSEQVIQTCFESPVAVHSVIAHRSVNMKLNQSYWSFELEALTVVERAERKINMFSDRDSCPAKCRIIFSKFNFERGILVSVVSLSLP